MEDVFYGVHRESMTPRQKEGRNHPANTQPSLMDSPASLHMLEN